METQLIPLIVARTVTLTGSPPRLVLAMSFHAACERVTPQPLLGPEGPPSSDMARTGVMGLHGVSTLTLVIEFSKSTSKSVAPAGGTNCTSSTFMLGGSSSPSSG